jgi:hypothetical protein
MNIFKVVIVASIALSSPAVAVAVAAETWKLGQSGNWHIKMSQNTSGNLLCGMMSMSRSGHVFNISVYEDGEYHLMITNTKSEVDNRDPFWIDVELQITSPTMYEEWTLFDAEIATSDNVSTVYTVMGYHPYPLNFLQDFMQGAYLDLMGSKGSHATWSLHGSAHAVTLLDKCRQRITGEL